MKDWLDSWLSKVTMYRLMTLSLATLLSVAGVLSLTGYFAFSFVSLLVSIGVFVAAVYGSGRLIGWLFSVKPHGESSIITALILACLFIPPELTVLAIAKLALIGIFATATKYVIAVRGRHIFNPAAAATVIASVTGIGFAGWWIATPALLPVLGIIGFLILQKTRTANVSGLFVIAAATLVTIQSVLNGLEVWQGIWFAFASWPILFLGAVMLSEPLTQPPRRYQQYILALLVAVLMVVPLRTEFISMTPALALIIGNAVAWWWGSRRALQLTFIKKVKLTPSTHEYVFEGNVPFRAGQYLEFTLPHAKADNRGVRRVFTIATNPVDTYIRFGIKQYDHPSTFKQTLFALEPGTKVAATRVAGDFVLPNDTEEPLVFVAGGIGITPFISFLRHVAQTNEKRDIVLFYAVSSVDEIAYKDVLQNSDIKVVIVVKGGTNNLPKEWEIVDAPYITSDIIENAVEDIHKRTVYISGPPLMVNAVARTAKKAGARKIMTDHFTGY